MSDVVEPFVEQRGPAGGAAFVFLHGTPGNRAQWEPLLASAPRDARIVLVDLPDHGQSPDEPHADNVAVEQAVERALDRVLAGSTAPVCLVGSSYGAWVAARIASRRPDLVTRVVLLTGFVSFGEADVAPRRAALAALKAGGPAVEAALAAFPAMLFGEHAGTPLANQTLGGIMATTSPERFERLMLRLLALDDPSLAVGAIAIPTCVVHGTRDSVVPFEHAERLRAHVPHAELVVLDTASHLPHVTHTAAVAARVFAA